MSTTQSTAAQPAIATRQAPTPSLALGRVRALAWQQATLFFSQAYTLLSVEISDPLNWHIVASYRPAWWRNVSASFHLSSRLFGDGFSSLAALPSGHMIASVPGAIISLAPHDTEFRLSVDFPRGTCPTSIIATPDGKLFFGTHGHHLATAEARVYTSLDRGWTWEAAYSFPDPIRVIRQLIYDEYQNCLWILTRGRNGKGLIFRASLDLRLLDEVASDKSMCVALPTREAVYLASDDPGESNHIFRLGRNGSLVRVGAIDGSGVSACRVGNSLFFSTTHNTKSAVKHVKVYRSSDGDSWAEYLHWKKDSWPNAFGNGRAVLAVGANATDLLAVTTMGVFGAHLLTTLWRI